MKISMMGQDLDCRHGGSTGNYVVSSPYIFSIVQSCGNHTQGKVGGDRVRRKDGLESRRWRKRGGGEGEGDGERQAGRNSERLKNLYFLYVILIQAIH